VVVRGLESRKTAGKWRASQNIVLARDRGGDFTPRSHTLSLHHSFGYQGNQLEGALETFIALHV
jgi:hypothetical protein